MDNKFFEVSHLSDSTLVKFLTIFDENVDLSKLIDQIGTTSEIQFDFDAVQKINSPGILKWISFVKQLNSSHSQVKKIAYRCRESIISNVNSFNEFLPKNFKIKSVVAPFYCSTCQAPIEYLLVENGHYSYKTKSYDLPKVQCKNESCEVEPDFLPERFFQFLHLK